MIIGESLYQPMDVFKMTTIHFTNVNRYTRAGKNGKQLKCPKCQSVRTIYHFNWSGLTCPECKESIDKYNWLVETRGVA